MDLVKLLTTQTRDAYNWANKLLEDISAEKWDLIPEVLETNITWQAGHLIMSNYFHAVLCISGHQKDIFQFVPLNAYNTLFTVGEPPMNVGKTDPKILFDQLKIVQDKSLEVVQRLSTRQLDDPPEPTKFPNPVASTKFEAIDWNIKHTMWHCGQIGLLKRVVDERYDFGLQAG